MVAMREDDVGGQGMMVLLAMKRSSSSSSATCRCNVVDVVVVSNNRVMVVCCSSLVLCLLVPMSGDWCLANPLKDDVKTIGGWHSAKVGHDRQNCPKPKLRRTCRHVPYIFMTQLIAIDQANLQRLNPMGT